VKVRDVSNVFTLLAQAPGLKLELAIYIL